MAQAGQGGEVNDGGAAGDGGADARGDVAGAAGEAGAELGNRGGAGGAPSQPELAGASGQPDTPEPCVWLMDESFAGAGGWEVDGAWEIGTATPSLANDCGDGDPALDHSADEVHGVAGTVIGGEVGVELAEMAYLTSPPIDSSAVASLTLGYWRSLHTDYPDYMVDTVEVFDGVTWHVVWTNPQLQRVDDLDWTELSHDVSSYRSNQTRVRFGYSIGAVGAFSCAGWSIDDVRLGTRACFAASELGAQ
jgi:hypothetical protein